ncbi:sulfatase [Maribacter ulvicola]|uniref:Arylsulfatase A n=1 Tax=Maribacter ulvicola TaxID=228959 RepID=A0A1N7ANL6_9FLAO|nr:sulfatase [Maribacter ulvicola]SIR40699.1 Arylsulfatase A [Maribacter ulvicola]
MKRMRIDLKRPILVVTILCFFSFFRGLGQETKPNIIVFLVDDMGWQDTSVPFWKKKTPFNNRYYTPNMERLASQGMKFTQAYATPICSPTRVSLMTGMNAARHRVTNWTLHKNTSTDGKDDHLEFPEWNVNGISPVPEIENTIYATSLPSLLKNEGYQTIHVGKAHFGAVGTLGEDPKNLGFDFNIAGHAAGAPESYEGLENFGNGKPNKAIWAVPGLQKYHGKDIFLTEALTREALITLDSLDQNKPFFLYMSHYAVHVPIYGDKRYLKKYLDAGLQETEAKYASMIEGMDKSLGDILDYLDRKNIADNTIVLFMSDNGGLSAHARGGEPNTHNKPLASGKGSFYEGGIREPMIVKWPNKVKPATTTDNYVIIEDFYPTILQMAGATNMNTVQHVDGKSFMPILTNTSKEKDEYRPLFWHYPNKWGGFGPGIGTGSAVRYGDWKLIYFHKSQTLELYNIKNDIAESNNLASKNKKELHKLASILTDYLKSSKAQMPKYKATGEPVPYPNEIVE